MCRLCAGTSLAAFALGLPRHRKHVEVQFFVELRQFALHGHSEQLRRHGGQDAVVTQQLESVSHREQWAGLQRIAMVEGERHLEGKVRIERRYFIVSLAPVAEPIARAVRAHWQVENGCHWVLDMTFREDDSRIRRGYGAENFSTLRHFALNLVKRHAPKLSVRKKRISAGFSDLFREELPATTGI